MQLTTRSTSRPSIRSTAPLRSRMTRVKRLASVSMRYPCFNGVSIRGTPLVARATGLDETPDLCSRKAKSPPILFWCAFFQVGTEHCRIGNTPDGGRQVSFSVKKQTSRQCGLLAQSRHRHSITMDLRSDSVDAR